MSATVEDLKDAGAVAPITLLFNSLSSLCRSQTLLGEWWWEMPVRRNQVAATAAQLPWQL